MGNQAQVMRAAALKSYVVFRVKVIEFLDIGALRQSLKRGEIGPYTPAYRTSKDFAESLRTVQLSWFTIFIDQSKDGMNVLELWKDLFPNRREFVESAWERMRPAWNLLR